MVCKVLANFSSCQKKQAEWKLCLVTHLLVLNIGPKVMPAFPKLCSVSLLCESFQFHAVCLKYLLLCAFKKLYSPATVVLSRFTSIHLDIGKVLPCRVFMACLRSLKHADKLAWHWSAHLRERGHTRPTYWVATTAIKKNKTNKNPLHKRIQIIMFSAEKYLPYSAAQRVF